MDVRLALARLCFLASILFVSLQAVEVGNRKKPDQIPRPIAKCQFGDISQNGKRFTINGNETWSADGEIRGKRAYVTWFRGAEAERYVAVYEITDLGEMVGRYCREENARYDDRGELVGGNHEHLYAEQ